MSRFSPIRDEAKEAFSAAWHVTEAARPYAEDEDEIMWAREDLMEMMLDLKEAVKEDDEARMVEATREVIGMMIELDDMI